MRTINMTMGEEQQLGPQATERLRFRRCTVDDAEFILALVNSPGWLQYIGDRGVYTVEEAKDYLLNRIFPAYEHVGGGPQVLVRRSDGALLGTVGVYKRPELESPDFGFALLPEYHRQGYAYEASLACLDYARAVGHTELLAITLPENAASNGLLQKLGFRESGELVRLPGDSAELKIYNLQFTM
ncbi:GNAT family N-acetyltransferase [Neolewinella lacunae]|uniref:GNAT family N-acetyltransferase n=1 Tax=Neolewinella lacunae TaxID=1517758 RepID=A0A923PMJ4_9BACT|nr:GNAT family N-acetyltransferase [Neolewinella lacunae]MBC6996209.1 GNAT family N-acetyltransferase [Neolewinella lacunae]MDN3637166.1 GNAT family N-acetyltransferase [Neolewinella lacunae]